MTCPLCAGSHRLSSCPRWRVRGLHSGVIDLRLAAAAAGLALSFAAGWSANGWRLGARLADLQRAHAEQAQRAQADARAEELRRVAAHQEIANVASLARARADDDRRAADAAHRRLLDAARAAGAAAADPGPAGGGAPTSGAGLVLADVLGSADDAAGELAAALDAARIAGLACERAYDALDRAQ